MLGPWVQDSHCRVLVGGTSWKITPDSAIESLPGPTMKDGTLNPYKQRFLQCIYQRTRKKWHQQNAAAKPDQQRGKQKPGNITLSAAQEILDPGHRSPNPRP